MTGNTTSTDRVNPPRLRLFVGPDCDGDVADAATQNTCGTDDGRLFQSQTLGGFYTDFARPCVLVAGGAAPANLAQYDESLRLWQHYTGDPPLPEIDDFACAAFVEALSARVWRGRRVKPATVRKHCVAVGAILKLAGPRSPQNPAGQGLIDQVPYLPRPRAEEDFPARDLSLEEIEQWLAGCQAATGPKIPGVEPAAWWRALVLWSYNTGLRIGTTLAARWGWIEGDWLIVPAAADKRRRGRKLWLNRPALEAAARIRRGDLVFGWTYRLQSFHQIRRCLVAAIDAERSERFRMHNLRRSLLTFLAAQNPAVARLQAGHSLSRDVLLRHYTDPAIVAELMARVPQPRCEAGDGEQLRLF